MKLRKHREMLDESMATVVELEATLPALLAAVQAAMGEWGDGVLADMLHVAPYCFDDRVGWDTYIVTVDGHGVFGFTDGPLCT